MYGRRRTTAVVALAAMFVFNQVALPLAAATEATATGARRTTAQATLEAAMAYPTLLAGKKQTTFVKVGLTGFKLKSEGERAAVNVAIVLDKSGSMSGDKIVRAKEAAINVIRRLRAQDIVSIVTYDSTVNVLVPATRLTDKETVIAKIRQIEAGGSTALFGGVSKGAEEVRKFLDRERVNRVILLSDGLANVGPQSPAELGAFGASLIKENISVSTMGLGLDYNEDLMAQLADKSDGTHAFIQSSSDLVAIFNAEFDDVLSVVAQEVAIDIECAEGIRPVRVINYDAEITGQHVIVKFNQIYSEQQKYLVLEVEVPATKANTQRPVATVSASYSNMQTKATDRLASSIHVNFSDVEADVEKYTNKPVAAKCVVQVGNWRNIQAILLRDQGDIEGSREMLRDNWRYLGKYAAKLGDKQLKEDAKANKSQSDNLEGEDYLWNRKEAKARQQQTGRNLAPRGGQ